MIAKTNDEEIIFIIIYLDVNRSGQFKDFQNIVSRFVLNICNMYVDVAK